MQKVSVSQRKSTLKVSDAMREIKFRGRDGDNWYYGSLFVNECGHTTICTPKSFWMKPVNADTVGQFTGLLDSNGREIYEGDLLEISPPVYDECKDFKFPVFYHKGAFIITGGIELCDFLTFGKVTIIGNIHDNPDLLEVEHD